MDELTSLDKEIAQVQAALKALEEKRRIAADNSTPVTRGDLKTFFREIVEEIAAKQPEPESAFLASGLPLTPFLETYPLFVDGKTAKSAEAAMPPEIPLGREFRRKPIAPAETDDARKKAAEIIAAMGEEHPLVKELRKKEAVIQRYTAANSAPPPNSAPPV